CARLPWPAAGTWFRGFAAGGRIPGREPEEPVRRGSAVTAAGSPAVLTAAAGDETAPAGIGAVRPAGGTGAELAARFPARPVIWSWPQTRASRQEILARLLAAPFALGNALSQLSVAVRKWLWRTFRDVGGRRGAWCPDRGFCDHDGRAILMT